MIGGTLQQEERVHATLPAAAAPGCPDARDEDGHQDEEDEGYSLYVCSAIQPLTSNSRFIAPS